MSIEDRLRTGLEANTEELRPNLEHELSVLLRRAHRRRQTRTVVASLVVAAALAAVAWFGDVPGLLRGATPNVPSKTPQVSATEPIPMQGIDGPLEPGTYAVPMWGDSDRLPRAVVDVPAGYGSPGGWVVDRGADGDPDNYGSVSYWAVNKIVTDPCEGKTVYEDVGPTVRDLADALAAQPGHTTTKPQPVTLDGYQGLYVEVTLPADAPLTACAESAHTLFGYVNIDNVAWYRTEIPGTIDRFWILDLDGLRVVMAASTTPNETPQEVAEVLDIAASTRFIDPLEP